jgi:uncharacterized protein (DUF433 family)
MSTVAVSHIEIDENGIAWIADANVKMIEIALDKLAHGSSPEEMHFQYPHLSLAQIHSALAYYYDHQLELDAEIQRRWFGVNKMAASEIASPLRTRFLELKGELDETVL